MSAGDILNPKRARTQANERLDTVDTEALSQAPRSIVDAYARAIEAKPRNAGGSTPIGLIFQGFGLTLNPTGPNDNKVRVQSPVGVAFDSNGRMLIKESGVTADLTLPAGTSQVYAYFIEDSADTTTRRFITVTSPYTEGSDVIATTLKGNVGYWVRAGDQTAIVATDVVNGATTALCFLGVAINTAGAVTMTGYDVVSAPNGAYAVNRITSVLAPSTLPPANTANGSLATVLDVLIAALYSVGQAMWKGSTHLTQSASNNYGAYTYPAGGVDKAFRETLGYVTIGNGTTVFGDFDTSDIGSTYANANALLTAAIAALPADGGQIVFKNNVGLSGFNSARIALPAGKTVLFRGDHSNVPANAPQLTFSTGEGFTCSATGKLAFSDIHIRHSVTIATLITSPVVLDNVYTENTNTTDNGAAFQGADVTDFYADKWFGSTVLTSGTLNAMLLRITATANRIYTRQVRHDPNSAGGKDDCGVIGIADVRDEVVLQDTTYVNGGNGVGGPVVKLATTDNTITYHRVVRGLQCGQTGASPPYDFGTMHLVVEALTGNGVSEGIVCVDRVIRLLGSTAYYARASWISIRIPFTAPLASVASGSVSSTGGVPGAEQAASSAVYYPLTIFGLAMEQRLQSVDVTWAAPGGLGYSVDCEVYVATFNPGSGARSFASVSGVVSGSGFGVTIPITTPSTNAIPYFVKVTTPGGGGVNLMYMNGSYDTP